MSYGVDIIGWPLTKEQNDAILERLASIPDHPTSRQTAQGAAISGIYHPPVLPWEGHNEDVLFTSDIAVEHSSMWPSEKAVIWALIAISFGLSIAALMS